MAIKKRTNIPPPTTNVSPESMYDDDETRARNPFLQGLRLDVYHFVLANEPCTRNDVASGLKLRMSSATARIKELIDEGILYEPNGKYKINPSGVKAKLLAVATENVGKAPRDRVVIDVEVFVAPNGWYYAKAAISGRHPDPHQKLQRVATKQISMVLPRIADIFGTQLNENVSVLPDSSLRDTDGLTIDMEPNIVKES